VSFVNRVLWLASRVGRPAVAVRRGRLGGPAIGAVIAAIALGACGAGHAAFTAVSGCADVSFQRVPGSPFGVVATRNGRHAFVDLVEGRVLLYSSLGFVPRLIRSIRVPGEAVGSSLTRDERLLLIADGQGATVVSVADAERGLSDPVLGTLSPPRTAHLRATGAIETSSSANGRYVFVSLEYGSPGGVIAVYRIGSSSAPRFGPADYVGAITLGSAVVGSALSPDGRYLYATSELARQSAGQRGAPGTLFKPGETLAQRLASRVRSRRLVRNDGLASLEPDGTLSVISVTTAERDPARAVLATVPALQQPVRVAVSPDGSVVWVTARASDRLLAFSAAKLLTDPARALLADVRVGTAPVGVAGADNGTRVIVADSNRFNAAGAHAAITIVDARAALARRPAIIANLRAGRFPREVAVEPDGVALVSNFASDQLEAIDIPDLR
jgi:DNA-binding beta-propeller fold protein YncE